MKVLVIGAAGKSGEALVNEALAAGHKVTAFVRGAAPYEKANVRVVAGDVLDAAAVDVAVAGQDAVIDALGGKTPWKVTTMETSAAHNIVDAMRRNGVRRLLKISVVGAGDSVKNAGFFNEHLLMRTFLRGLLVDKAGMEAEIEGSNLDWTLVRPPMLTDGEKTGVARVLSTEGGEKAHKIGRADLAAFMVQQLESSRYVHLADQAGCSDCHTPQVRGQNVSGMDFAGGFPFTGPWGTVASANITPDSSGIPYYDEALFLNVMRTGQVGARELSPIMPVMVYRNLTNDDLKAIFAFLRTTKPVKHRVDNSEPPTDCKVCNQKHGAGSEN